jgi:crossover junction endodeoxyribonuclease RuvC
MRILGIDPGLQVTGYAVLGPAADGPALCEAGVIRTADGSKTADMAKRLATIYDAVVEVFDQWKPGVVVVEQLYAHYEHPRTAILMGHARGVFFLLGGQRGVPVLSYPATKIKKTITGSGRAGKEQMQYAIMREFGLAAPPEPHDVADAIGVALCHYFLGNSPRRGAQSALHTGVNMKALLQDHEDE